jgi:TPR repeat protein
MSAIASSVRADVAAGWAAYTAEDYAAADQEWRPLADKGNRDAAFGLGMLAQVTGQEKMAAHWYEQAARRGLTAAQVLLGGMYAQGVGVPQDSVLAYAWLHRATVDGHTNAAVARDAVGAILAPDQIAEAKQLSERLRQPQ